MAPEERTTTDPVALLAELREEPYRFDLYDALRRLECAYRHLPRWGESDHVREDPLRLAQEPSLAFAPSQLESLEAAEDGRPPRLRVFYPGLFGPNGPLPLHLTEFARERKANERDVTFARFVDIFHHRLIALFYRAWSTSQPEIQYDRPEADRIASLLGALIGMGSPTLRHRGSRLDRALLHHTGGLASPTRHAEGLRGLLADFFKAEVRIESFVGYWIVLPLEAQSRLGRGGNANLGSTATAGSRVWDCQHKFRIVFGPLGFDDYRRLLPGGESLPRLVTLVRAYAGDDLLWDANLVIRKEAIPPLSLDGSAALGRTTWLRSQPPERDCDELILEPLAGAA